MTGRQFYRRFYCIHGDWCVVNIPDSFWRSTASCLYTLRYNETFFLASTTRVEYPGYDTIERKQCEILQPGEATILSTIGERNVVNYDCRLSKGIVNTDANLDILRSTGIVKEPDSFRWYQRALYRILLNPTPDVIKVIRNFKEKHFTGKIAFGIQVRTGGCWADFNERTAMISNEEIMRIPSIIRKAMAEYRYNPTKTVFYLSTDSRRVEAFIKESLSEFTILTSTEFARSHSRTLSNSESLKSALVDIFMLSDSDTLFICKGSGFGRMSKYMTRAKHIIQYKVTHRPETRYDESLRSCTSYDNFSDLTSKQYFVWLET